MENVKILTENLVSLFSCSGGWILFIVGIACCIIGIVFSLIMCSKESLVLTFIGTILLIITLFISAEEGDKYCKIYEIVPLEDKIEIDTSKYEVLEYRDNGIIKIKDKTLYDSEGNEIKGE